MNKRQETLLELHSCIEGIDKEITMILQNLQWDRKHLLEGSSLVSCKYEPHHRVPPDRKAAHEEECFLRCEGYASDDEKLPAPLDDTAPTIVKLSNDDITQIINRAALADPSFKRGPPGCAPLTAGRLQASYTADERRAIHDAAVSAAPAADCGEDLALPGSTSDENKKRPKSKMEVLAELRDMRRRRAKYRGASGASKNYSNVLRDVIKTQMELFTGIKEEPEETTSEIVDNTREHKHYCSDNKRDERRGKIRDEYKSDRYQERNKLEDKKYNDSYKQKHHSREHREKQKERYGDEKVHESDSERHIKKERDKYTNTKDYYEEGNGHTSYKSRHRRIDDVERREPRPTYRDASESRSERSYKSDKYHESTSSRRYKEEYEIKCENSRSTKRHRETDRERHDDTKHSKHHGSKRRDEHSYDKKRKRHS